MDARETRRELKTASLRVFFVIVFFSFIGTITAIAFKKVSKVEEEVVLLDTEPVEVRRQGNIMRGEI